MSRLKIDSRRRRAESHELKQGGPFMSWNKTRFLSVAVAVVVVAASASARGADFYSGKTITIIVGQEAGSGYDAYARVLSRHMTKYIPGKPNIVVQNMPGAGSVTAAQYLYVPATKDGTIFGLLFPGAIVEPLTGDPAKYRYDPTKFEYLGTADSGTRLCVMNASSGVNNFADLKQRKALVGATANIGPMWDYAYFFNALARTKFQVVSGYKGPADVLLAIERGEVDGLCAIDSATILTLRPDWVNSPKVKIILQAGMEPNQKFTKLGVPSMWEYLPPEDRAVGELFVSQQVFARPFVAPPGVPRDRMDILRDAFMRAYADPEALEEASRMKIDINPLGGEAVSALVKKFYGSPKELIDRMARAIRP